MMSSLICFAGCNFFNKKAGPAKPQAFNYNVEQFADLGIIRYEVKNWDSLNLNQKKLVYALSQAALHGRDILYDQNNRYNLAIRRTLEAIYQNYQGDVANPDYQNLVVYLKRVWFSNGIHHHYGSDKFVPAFSEKFFIDSVRSLQPTLVPTREGQSVDEFIGEIVPVIFNPELYAKKVVQAADKDVIALSANNYYGEGVTQPEAEKFYQDLRSQAGENSVPFGLNSRLIKKDGKVQEDVYKVGGLYTASLEKIVHWLNEATQFAENEQQKKVIELLIQYYQSGDLQLYDEYSVEWVKDTASLVDFVNGFTETYGDALGLKGSWEALVNYKDLQSEAATKIIMENAQWFEDNAPIDPRFKKEEVKGIVFKAITAAILSGDLFPATAIGINLPNSNWIRKEVGSKSVTITNITEAYDKAAEGSGFNEEFVLNQAERDLLKKYGAQTNNLHTDLHECVGHASGQLLPGVDREALKIYSSTLEEARADLFALYYIADPKMVQTGLLPDGEAYKSEYYKYMLNGLLTQLARIELGNDIEEAHMRNRALIANWVLQHGQADKIVELSQIDGKTYVLINDYDKMRALIGQLLAEVQRIKSEGDIAAAQKLVETYAVKVDPVIHQEVKERYAALNIPPYKGFVNPVYNVVSGQDGEIADIKVTYTEGFAQQMLRYAQEYSDLPTYND